ncbi:hypothetical protein SELMODRAFT_432197 [Selaginella moellendorffii]|uniref:Secreted protein n=1 Tax=Selaginella moellendorffii TaxID=88036 RepID=D8TF99_SELML|nr:hypothetical protein SELMODRAFT_432197 [Selaginella moellendorffii]
MSRHLELRWACAERLRAFLLLFQWPVAEVAQPVARAFVPELAGLSIALAGEGWPQHLCVSPVLLGGLAVAEQPEGPLEQGEDVAAPATLHAEMPAFVSCVSRVPAVLVRPVVSGAAVQPPESEVWTAVLASRCEEAFVESAAKVSGAEA